MDAQENNVDLFKKHPQVFFASPVLKIVWMILLIAIKYKCKAVSFSRKRGKRGMAVKLDNEHDMVPPPRHLFPLITKVLRCIGRNAIKNSQSPFQFIYTETGQEQKLDWFIDYNAAPDVDAELNNLMQKIHEAEEAERKLWNEKWRRQIQRKRYVVAGIFALAILVFSTSLLLMLW